MPKIEGVEVRRGLGEIGEVRRGRRWGARSEVAS